MERRTEPRRVILADDHDLCGTSFAGEQCRGWLMFPGTKQQVAILRFVSAVSTASAPTLIESVNAARLRLELFDKDAKRVKQMKQN